jgi:hypothetical protein
VTPGGLLSAREICPPSRRQAIADLEALCEAELLEFADVLLEPVALLADTCGERGCEHGRMIPDDLEGGECPRPCGGPRIQASERV